MYQIWGFLLVASAVVKGGIAGLASEKNGPYMVLVRHVAICNERDDSKIRLYSKMKRVDRKTLMVVGNLTTEVSLGDNLFITLQLDQKTAQGFKENYFFTDFGGKKGACSVFEEYGDESDFARLLGAIKNANYTKCPVDPGSYEFEMDVLVEPFKKVPAFFYNTYRVLARFYEDLNQPPIGCIDVLVDLIPKKKNKG